MNKQTKALKILNYLEEYIERIANKETPLEDDPYSSMSERCGGNFYDAYELGMDSGEISMARRIRAMLYELRKENKNEQTN